ncbi:MAG: leucine-rich repeat protein, partial [Bacteroidales bacterium]|nr:leucine-rich repeat protein [Bacteroidales bacterium]
MGSSSYPVFSGCTSLSTLNIGENVTNIPSYAFYNCRGLTSLTYNAANCAFGNNNGITGNTSIRTLTIGESVTNYPVSAFRGLS